MRTELIRKGVHCFGCVAALVAAELPFSIVVGVSAAVGLVFLAEEFLRMRGRTLPPVTAITRACSRPSEEGWPAMGPIALAFGLVCSFALFPARMACAVLVMACIVDSAAALVGKSMGRHPIPYSRKKTVEGTLAGALCALPFGMWFLGPAHGALIAVAAALIESLPLSDLDNLLIPLGAGCLLAMIGA